MNNVMPLLPGDKVKIHSGHLQGWGQPTQAMTHLYMKMLTNRNALIVKLNLITMPEQTIKVSECQPTTVWRIVVLFKAASATAGGPEVRYLPLWQRPVQPVLAPAAPENQHPQLAPTHTVFLVC